MPRTLEVPKEKIQAYIRKNAEKIPGFMIAQRFDISYSTVWKIAREMRIKLNHARGASKEIVQERIRQVKGRSENMTLYDIASEFSISYESAFAFCKRYGLPFKRYRDVKNFKEPEKKSRFFRVDLPHDKTWLI